MLSGAGPTSTGPRLTRRAWLALAGGLALAASSSAPAPAEQRWRVGMVVLEVTEDISPAVVPDGWDWAADGPQDMTILVKGSTAFPTPELALSRVLAPDQDGRVAWTVVRNPPQPVVGTSRYAVLDVRSVGPDQRSGTLLAATVEGRTAVVLVHAPRGWSPALRRSVLSGIEVTGAD